MRLLAYSSVLTLTTKAFALSCSPGRPFPPPSYSEHDFAGIFQQLDDNLETYLANPAFDSTNVAIEVTSSHTTLWSFSHSAADKCSQAGTTTIDRDTVFRVARVSKLLTSIAVLRLHDQGLIASLQNAITDYLPDLEPSAVDWNRVTVWDLMNNMAGIVDMYGYGDVLTDFSAHQREALGFPPVSEEDMATLPACQRDRSIRCDSAGFLQWLRSSKPVFDPHVINSNSNVGTSLLGILIAHVTGAEYEKYIDETLIKPLNMSSTSFTTSVIDRSSVLQNDTIWAWDVGINNPSVGLYSTPRDMSGLLRWLLQAGSSTSTWTSAAPAPISHLLNVFMPGFYAVGSHSLIGMPWNVFRSAALFPTRNRPVTFNTVVGTLGTYTSIVVLVPEYDLSYSIMMNGALGHPHAILNQISTPLIRAADGIAWRSVRKVYAGTYQSKQKTLNTSLTLSQDAEKGLYISNFISNSTNILPAMNYLTALKSGAGPNWVFQLIPTMLGYNHERYADGSLEVEEEEWRWTYVLDKDENGEMGWNDWCLSSFDPVTYAGKPLTKVVFVRQRGSGRVLGLRIIGWDVWLEKNAEEEEQEHWEGRGEQIIL